MARLRLAACLAVGAVGAAADAREEPLVSIEAASVTRREALVRILDAAGEDYALGPGFSDRVALRLVRVPVSAVLRGLLREDESTWTVSGVRLVARGHGPRQAQRLRLVPVPGSEPGELARVVEASLGPGARVAVDADARLLLIQGPASAVEGAEKVLVQFEAPLPCVCEPGDRDLLAGGVGAQAEEPGGAADEPITASRASVPAGEALLALVKRAGVALAPTAVEGEVSYRFRDVPARSALAAVAEVLGGGRVVGGTLVPSTAPGEAQARFVTVRSRPAAQLLPVLRALAWEGGPVESSAARDRVHLRGGARGLEQAEAVVRRLDFAPRPESNPCGCRASSSPGQTGRSSK